MPALIEAPLLVVSVGGGQDSTAIVYRLGLDAAFRRKYAGDARILCVMSATGDEHDDTDAHVPVLRAFCESYDMEFVHLTFDMGFHSASWSTGLRGFYEAKNAIGSAAYPKTCSENLKIAPIYRYLARYIAVNIFGDEALAFRKTSLYLYEAAYGPLNVAIGIALGEESRVAKAGAQPCVVCDGTGENIDDTAMDGLFRTLAAICRVCKGSGVKPPRHKWMEDCVERVYPLIPERMDRAACQAYIESDAVADALANVIVNGVPANAISNGAPAKVSPSNCYMCPFKSAIEILWSWMVDPERFAVWVAIEQRKLDANTHMNAVPNPKTGKLENKNYGVFKLKTLPMILDEAKHEYAGWSFERIADYRHSHGHCVASVY